MIEVTEPIQRAALVRAQPRLDLDLVEELDAMGASADVLRAAAAGALRGRVLEADARATRWLGWLVLDSWRSGCFVEAWILRRAIPTPDGLPSLALSQVAALLGAPDLDDALESAALQQGLTAHDAVALSLVTATEMLVAQQDASRTAVLDGILEVLAGHDSLASPWTELVDLCRDQYRRAALPLPMRAISAERGLAEDRQNESAAWERLLETWTSAEAMQFSFELGTKTHAYLFHEQGIFGELGSILRRRDGREIAEWAARPELRDLDDLLDRASHEVLGGKEVLHSRRRRSLMQRLRDLKVRANEVARLVVLTGVDDDDANLIAAQPAARRLGELWPAIEVAVGEQREARARPGDAHAGAAAGRGRMGESCRSMTARSRPTSRSLKASCSTGGAAGVIPPWLRSWPNPGTADRPRPLNWPRRCSPRWLSRSQD